MSVDEYNRKMNYFLGVDVNDADEYYDAKKGCDFAWTRFTAYASCVEDQGYMVDYNKVGPYLSEVLIYKSVYDNLPILTIDTLPNF